jgi:hypothetical protein
MPRTTTPPAGQEKLVGPEGRVERSERILPYDRIHLFDVHRLLVGEVQWSFLAEVFDRGVLTCVILVAIIWLMGTGSFFLFTEAYKIILSYIPCGRHEQKTLAFSREAAA